MSLKVQWNPAQRRTDSGELDVFEATEYFSSYNEVVGYNNSAFLSEKAMREERRLCRGKRMSLDMQVMASLPSHSHRVDNLEKKEKQKLTNSPGGRLASFLKTLFHQTGSKKKKSMLSFAQSMKGVVEIPDAGRREMRNNMSLFQSIKTNESKSVYSSSTASGFRTPPPYVDTPTKTNKNQRSYSDRKHVVSLQKYTGNYVNPVTSKDEVLDGNKNKDVAWMNEKSNFIDMHSLSMKDKNMINNDRLWVPSDKKNMKLSVEGDDVRESDSSSDLFELENHDLSAC